MGSPPPKLSNPPVFFYETGGTAREEGKGREGEGVRVGELRGGFSGGGRLEVMGERMMMLTMMAIMMAIMIMIMMIMIIMIMAVMIMAMKRTIARPCRIVPPPMTRRP